MASGLCEVDELEAWCMLNAATSHEANTHIFDLNYGRCVIEVQLILASRLNCWPLPIVCSAPHKSSGR